jgi:hypothetical protein
MKEKSFHLKIIHVIIQNQTICPWKVTCWQVPRIRTWAFWRHLPQQPKKPLMKPFITLAIIFLNFLITTTNDLDF